MRCAWKVYKVLILLDNVPINTFNDALTSVTRQVVMLKSRLHKGAVYLFLFQVHDWYLSCLTDIFYLPTVGLWCWVMMWTLRELYTKYCLTILFTSSPWKKYAYHIEMYVVLMIKMHCYICILYRYLCIFAEIRLVRTNEPSYI